MSITPQQIAAALAQRVGPLDLFFRDDDVDEDEPSLRRLLALFISHRTPVCLGVIPGRLTEAAVALLNDAFNLHPHLIELAQHGWQHVNHEPEGKKSEFGVHRDFGAQRADIAAGQKRMHQAFSERWFPAFIPPWNRCTSDTARALDQLGFRALSRDVGAPPFAHTSVRELPVTLDLFRWRGGAQLRSEEELTQELMAQIAGQDRIGVMLHHKVMGDDAFALLDRWLTQLCAVERVRVHTLQRLLEQPSAA